MENKRNKPKLKYCEANVNAIYDNFIHMTKHKSNSDPYLRKSVLSKEEYEEDKLKYKFLIDKKKQLEPAAFRRQGWSAIKDDTFDKLIGLLYDKDCLTIWDNHLCYQSNEILFHSLNHFYGNDPNLDFKSLAGEYRTFNVGLFDNKVITKGHLIIEYVEDGNYLQTKHIASHKDNKEKFVYEYSGVITFYRNTKYLIMKDVPTRKSSDYGNNYRISRLYITKKDKEGKIFEGATWLDTGSKNVKRKFFIDNYLDEEPEPNEKSISIDRYNNTLPPRYKKALEDDNILSEFFLSPVLG